MSPQSAAGDRESQDDLAAPARHDMRETAAFDPAAARQTQELGATPAGAEAHPAPRELPKQFGRYRIQSRLGFGGMGSVFLARDTQLDRDVALKVPRLTADPTGTLVERFNREARAAATLNHPNICPIFDVGQVDGVNFIAMAYVEGKPLTAYIESGKQQPERQVALVVRKVALALQEAHGRGIVHRDLKPANIMIDRRGEPIVMDFGLACRVDDGSTRLTQDGVLVGTPAYMSPEQIDQRAPVGPAADIYSLGVVLYELLTGSCPFQGNVVSVIGQVLHAEPKPLSELRPDVSAAMSELCSRAMAKDSLQRFPTMKDMALALGMLLKQESGSGAGVTAAATQTTVEPTTKIERLDELWGEALPAAVASPASSLPSIGISAGGGRRSLRPWVIAGAAMVALAVVGIGLAMALRDSPRENQPTADKSTPARAAVAPPAAMLEPAAATRTAEPVEPAIAVEPPPAPIVVEPVPAISPAPAPIVTAPTVTAPTPVVPEIAAPMTPVAANPPTEQAKPEPESPGLGFPPGQPPPAGPALLSKEALSQKFQQNDRNGDGKLDSGETPMHIIMRADKNRDRALTLAEVEAAYQRLGAKLFDPPTAAEQRKMPRPPEPRGGPGGEGPGPGPPPRPPRSGGPRRP